LITTCDPAELPLPGARGAVLSLGVFDGVHLGHQAILARNVELARAANLLATVVTFRSHPKGVILGRAPRTLTTLAHRLELFRRAGIDHTLALEFDAELRSMSPEKFVRELLVPRLLPERFVLGFDSKFGRDRAGGPALLRELGFEVDVVPKVVVAQRAVSSSAIREAVELGDLAGAACMLGRPVSVLGEVVRGAELGRALGFPTANLDLHHELHPPPGVYACRAHLVDPQAPAEVLASHPAVANIGFRPTVAATPGEEPHVEVHLLDFDGDLYGTFVELEFVAPLRGERRFADLDALKAQIARDVEDARRHLAARESR